MVGVALLSSSSGRMRPFAAPECLVGGAWGRAAGLRCARALARCGAGLAVLIAAAAAAVAAPSDTVRPVPALTARVIDETGTLGAQREALDAKLAAFEQASGPQMVVLMVPTTAPEDIAAYANRVADTWKVGRHDVGDGILILVAKDDRRVRIEVARALEGAVPDLAARQIIDRAIMPAFKAGDYAGGLSGAIDLLEARIKGENLPMPDASTRPAAPGTQHGGRGARGTDWGQLAIMFFFGVFIVGRVLRAFLGRTAGTLVAGVGAGALAWMAGAGVAIAALAGVFALIMVALTGAASAVSSIGGGYGRRGGFGSGVVLGSMLGHGLGSGGGGGGFGGGGGGFSSGGGGSFGGGGASGQW